MLRLRATRLLTLAFVLASAPSFAFVEGPIDNGPTALKALARNSSPLRPVVDEQRQQLLRSAPAWQQFVSQNGDWHVDFDLESERPRRMLGEGIPLIPGELNGLTLGDLPLTEFGPVADLTQSHLEAVAKAWLGTHQGLFHLDLGEWELDDQATQLVDHGRLQVIHLVRRVGGVLIPQSRVLLGVKMGNLIYVSTLR